MNPVRGAIYTRLTADTTLMALLSGPNAVVHGVAPSGVVSPYIVIQALSDTPAWKFQGESIENDVWMLRAVHRATSASIAEDIAARANVVLTDAPLNVTGRDLLAIYRETGPQAYPEVEAGETHWHCLSTYRLITEP